MKLYVELKHSKKYLFSCILISGHNLYIFQIQLCVCVCLCLCLCLCVSVSVFRQTEIGFLYEGKLTMQKHLRNSGFQYKYVVKKLSSKGNKSKIIWELVQRKEAGIDPAVVIRRFLIPEQKRSHTGWCNKIFGALFFNTRMHTHTCTNTPTHTHTHTHM